jgi:hypothetical protein
VVNVLNTFISVFNQAKYTNFTARQEDISNQKVLIASQKAISTYPFNTVIPILPFVLLQSASLG